MMQPSRHGLAPWVEVPSYPLYVPQPGVLQVRVFSETAELLALLEARCWLVRLTSSTFLLERWERREIKAGSKGGPQSSALSIPTVLSNDFNYTTISLSNGFKTAAPLARYAFSPAINEPTPPWVRPAMQIGRAHV